MKGARSSRKKARNNVTSTRASKPAQPTIPAPQAPAPAAVSPGATRVGVTDVEWALRDLLWLATWNSGPGPDVTDEQIASQHARLLQEVIDSVRRQYETTVVHVAKNSPVRTRDEFLVAIADGIAAVLDKDLGYRANSNSKPAAVVERVKLWLDAWQGMAREPEIPASMIERVMDAPSGIGAMKQWVKDAPGAVEATAQLLEELEIVGRTRLFELRSADRDDDIYDLVRRAYGGVGVQPRELRDFAMRLVRFSDAAIAAAQKVQLEPIELDFFFGTWLR